MSRERKSPWTFFDDVISIELKFIGTIEENDKWRLSIRNSIKDMNKGQNKWHLTKPTRRYRFENGVTNVEWMLKAQFNNKELATLFKLTWC